MAKCLCTTMWNRKGILFAFFTLEIFSKATKSHSSLTNIQDHHFLLLTIALISPHFAKYYFTDINLYFILFLSGIVNLISLLLTITNRICSLVTPLLNRPLICTIWSTWTFDNLVNNLAFPLLKIFQNYTHANEYHIAQLFTVIANESTMGNINITLNKKCCPSTTYNICTLLH